MGTWKVIGSTNRWPRVVNMWEMDGWDHWAESLERQFFPSKKDPALAPWWAKATEWRSGGFDRICEPTASGPTCAEMQQNGFERMGVRPFAGATRAGQARCLPRRCRRHARPGTRRARSGTDGRVFQCPCAATRHCCCGPRPTSASCAGSTPNACVIRSCSTGARASMRGSSPKRRCGSCPRRIASSIPIYRARRRGALIRRQKDRQSGADCRPRGGGRQAVRYARADSLRRGIRVSLPAAADGDLKVHSTNFSSRSGLRKPAPLLASRGACLLNGQMKDTQPAPAHPAATVAAAARATAVAMCCWCGATRSWPSWRRVGVSRRPRRPRRLRGRQQRYARRGALRCGARSARRSWGSGVCDRTSSVHGVALDHADAVAEAIRYLVLRRDGQRCAGCSGRRRDPRASLDAPSPTRSRRSAPEKSSCRRRRS